MFLVCYFIVYSSVCMFSSVNVLLIISVYVPIEEQRHKVISAVQSEVRPYCNIPSCCTERLLIALL